MKKDSLLDTYNKGMHALQLSCASKPNKRCAVANNAFNDYNATLQGIGISTDQGTQTQLVL